MHEIAPGLWHRLTNRHDDRDAWRPPEAFGSQVHGAANGVHELEGRGSVTPFQLGAVAAGAPVTADARRELRAFVES